MEGFARKACTRCSTQKKKCNRALPQCRLCVRLHHKCKYESLPDQSSSPPSTEADSIFGSAGFTLSRIRDAIVQKLGSIQPQSVISCYSRIIYPCFPIVSLPRLQSRISDNWGDSSLESSLLGLSIVLLTSPLPSPEDDFDSSESKSLYLYIKGWIALTEGLGLNSLELLQTRVLVALFETLHGLYPAAHISIRSAIGAADALIHHPVTEDLHPAQPRGDSEREDMILTWCGITILDRYIALESSVYKPLTQFYTPPVFTPLESYLCPPNIVGEKRGAPLGRFSRLFETVSVLDSIQTHLSTSIPGQITAINMEEIFLMVNMADTLKKVLLEEIQENEIYSSGFAICDICMLLAYEHGAKITPVDGLSSNCVMFGVKSLDLLISNITQKIESLMSGISPIEYELVTPPVIFLVYKTASIVTGRLWMEKEKSEGLRRLKILRGFLKEARNRWLCCERYLQLLNEDTTPRILKVLEQDS